MLKLCLLCGLRFYIVQRSFAKKEAGLVARAEAAEADAAEWRGRAAEAEGALSEARDAAAAARECASSPMFLSALYLCARDSHPPLRMRARHSQRTGCHCRHGGSLCDFINRSQRRA